MIVLQRSPSVLHETEGDLKDMPARKMPETCRTSQKLHPDAFAGGRDPKIHVRKGLRQNIMRLRFPISTFPLKLSRSQEQASRIKPSCTLAASMVRVSHGKCIEIPPHGLPGLHHSKSVCLRASPESSARPHSAFEIFRISSTFKRMVFPCHVGLPTLRVTMNRSDSQVLLLLVHRHQKPPRRFVVRVLSKSGRSILFSISKPCTCSKH